MISLLTSRMVKITLPIVALVVAYGGGYIKGRSDGKIQQLEATVKAHETRNEIEETVGDLGAADLCVALGGLPNDCSVAVRRLQENPVSE